MSENTLGLLSEGLRAQSQRILNDWEKADIEWAKICEELFNRIRQNSKKK